MPDPSAPSPRPGRLGAFRHRDFRLFWSGQLVSLIGTWMQSVGQSWLVLELTGSPFQLGLVNTLQFTPILLLSAVGGALRDRLGKRRILLFTQAAMMAQAFVLALLVRSGHVRYWHVAVLATIYGVGRAIDIPARQSFLSDLVGKADLPNAVALNSVVFNGARIVGPGVAGLLIARFDVAIAFFLNGASFVAVLTALVAIRTEGHPDPAGRLGIRQGLMGAAQYALSTPAVGFTLSLLVVVSLLVLNFNVVVPLIARDVLHEGAEGFGLLMSALGAGAIAGAAGAPFLAARSSAPLLPGRLRRPPRRGRRPPGAGRPLRDRRGAPGRARMPADLLLDELQHHAAAHHAARAPRPRDGPLRAGLRGHDAVRLAARGHHRGAPGCACRLRPRRHRGAHCGGRARPRLPAP